ncbi:hypothetical protein LBMAG42_46920 [Deltaproteobacteria bacterium]|nr:hypothetical protein LBMAG42_46920 [Deltaproteobacteria bacterium]
MYDYPYRLKLIHGEFAELRLERRGRTILIDPSSEPEAGDIVVITGPGPTRLRGTVAALQKGVTVTVVAPDPIIDYLGKHGTIIGGPGPRTIDDVKFDGCLYAPPAPHIGVRGQFFQASVAAARPRATLRRLGEQMRGPGGEPWIVEITFPDGSRLLHLDLALHTKADDAWVARAAARFGNPEWIIAGVPFGEGGAVFQLLPRFGPNRVLLTELLNGERRELGLPTELVTPWRDRLQASGVETHVFATQTSFRFE